MIAFRAARRLLWFSTLGLSEISCGADCVQPPCPLPFAVTVTVTAGATGSTVAGAFVQQLDSAGAVVNLFPCDGGSCIVFGGPATYTLVIGATGFQNAQRTVVVHGTTATCGCGSTDTVHLDVALAAAT